LSAPRKQKRVKGKKAEERPKRTVKEKVLMPAGAPPSATVETRLDGRMMQRQARGYSLGEVSQAGLNFRSARRWGLLVDDRRRSALEGNVASLKKWSLGTKKTTEKKVAGEARRIEMAVEKEVRKVEKEVKKVEKEVVEKVEAPLKKRSKKRTTPPT